MQFVTRPVPKNFNIFFLGDLHIGSTLFHERGFRSFIEATKNDYYGVKHNVIIGMGDYIEAIDTSDKRFDVDTTDLKLIRPEHQMDFFVEALWEIREKIVVLLYGNHEDKLLRYCDYVRGACTDLETEYGTFSSVVTFKNQDDILFKTFVTHGRGTVGSTADSPERRSANMLLQMKRKLHNKSGDCAVMAFGHTHKVLIAEPERTLYLESNDQAMKQKYTSSNPSDRFIPKDHRWYINTGSFLRLYKQGVSGYAERAMYDPLELGYPVLRVRDGLIAGVDKVIVM